MTDKIKELIKGDPFLALSICACNAYDFYLCYHEFVKEHVKLKFEKEFADSVWVEGNFYYFISNIKTQSGSFSAKIDHEDCNLIIELNGIKVNLDIGYEWTIDSIESDVKKLIFGEVYRYLCAYYKIKQFKTTRPKKNQLSLFGENQNFNGEKS